jgi:hypothetical protein
VSLDTKALLQFVLNGGSTFVDSIQRKLAVHTDMSLYGYVIANATSTQVVRLLDIGKRLDNLFYLLFCFCWQRLLCQLANTHLKQFISYLYQHQTHNNRSQGIEHRPSPSKPDGQSDA